MSVRQRFLEEHNKIEDFKDVKYLVMAVKLPTGSIELIVNTSNILNKMQYYTVAYNEDFRLCTNKDVQVVNYMIVL